MNHCRYLVASTVILLCLTSCSCNMMTNYPAVSTAVSSVMGSEIIAASISNEVYASTANSKNVAPTTTDAASRSAASSAASMMNPLPSISPTPDSRPPSSIGFNL